MRWFVQRKQLEITHKTRGTHHTRHATRLPDEH